MAVAGALVCALSVAAPGTAAPAQETGREVWIDRYDPERNAAGIEVLVAADGSAVYAVGGTSESDDSAFYRVAAFDPATGEDLWSAERPGNPHVAALSSDGARIYLAGTVRTDDVTFDDWNVIALDTVDGEELWSAISRFRGRRDNPNDVVVSPDGRSVHVVGRAMEYRRASHDLAVVTLDAATGEEEWSDLYDGPPGRHDEALGVAVAPDGDALFVTGFVTKRNPAIFGGGDTRYVTIAYGLKGDDVRLYQWVTHHNGPGRDPAFDMPEAIETDGKAVYVTGQSASKRGHPDWLTIAYRAGDATELWSARYNRSPRSEDAPNAMALGPGGARIYVTGASSNRDFDATTVAYRTRNGTRAWTSHFGDRAGQDFGWDIAASPDGERVYVSAQGVIDLAEADDFVTIGYSAHDGSEEWSARYSGSGSEYFPNVAVQPDSARVFVVGREIGDGNFVFTTLAYEPPR